MPATPIIMSMAITTEPQDFLRLLQIADSALPIGGIAHSYGLETLAADGVLTVDALEDFLRDYFSETGLVEAVYCRMGHTLCAQLDFPRDAWIALNRDFSAWKTARESRNASAALGRQFLQLAVNVSSSRVCERAIEMSRAASAETHLACAFGLTGGALDLGQTATVLAYLHYSLAGLVSACQRLLPLGQRRASRILWNLKPALVETAEAASAIERDQATCFVPLVDIASMRHPWQVTRLFVS